MRAQLQRSARQASRSLLRRSHRLCFSMSAQTLAPAYFLRTGVLSCGKMFNPALSRNQWWRERVCKAFSACPACTHRVVAVAMLGVTTRCT